jgi:hypothetical protein
MYKKTISPISLFNFPKIFFNQNIVVKSSLYRQVTAFALLASLGFGCGGGDSDEGNILTSTTAVGRWNTISTDASGRDHGVAAPEQGGPTKTSRALAIVHLAIHDAIQTIEQDFTRFADSAGSEVSVSSNASINAAVAVAAHDTLVALYPSQASIFDQELAKDLASVRVGLEDGTLAGQQAAKANLELRSNDGSDNLTQSEPYIISDEPGKWRPDPVNPNQRAFGANWAKVTPFVLASADQFRAPPPPAIDSVAYAESYAETFRLGGDGITTPTERTQEQTDIGIFWAYDGTPSLCAPPRLYNQIALKIAEIQGVRSEGELARLLAYVNLAMADTGIAAWDTKYFYNYWRPVTGIRESDVGTGPTGLGDGNDLTPGDVAFSPLGAPASNLSSNNFTPPFPAYVSGHAAFGGALFEVLRQYFGRDDIAFTFVSDELDGVTLDNAGRPRRNAPRSFSSLSEAEEENGQSRMYLGIHWSFDKTEGVVMGNNVARYILSRTLLPGARTSVR